MAQLDNSWLEKSWERSQKYSVDPTVAKDAILGEFEFRQYFEKKEAFLREVVPKLQRLAEWVKTLQSVILVSDSEGCILESMGDPVFLRENERIQLSKGAIWSERVRGTNTAGTTIVEQKPLAVVGNQHYLEAVHKLYCTSSPIFDPRGELFSVLNITGYCETYHPSLLGMVDVIAREIEDWLLLHRSDKQMIIALDSQQKKYQRALLAVDSDGVLVGANREARTALSLTKDSFGQVLITQMISGIQPLLQRNKGIHLHHITPLQCTTNEQDRWLASVLFDTRPAVTKPLEKKIKKTVEPNTIHQVTF